MIVKGIEVKIEVSETNIVKVSVFEPYLHKYVVFLNRFCIENNRTPKIGEWMDFFKRVKAPRDAIDSKIKFFNKIKTSKDKHDIQFQKLFAQKIQAPKIVRKVVKKRT